MLSLVTRTSADSGGASVPGSVESVSVMASAGVPDLALVSLRSVNDSDSVVLDGEEAGGWDLVGDWDSGGARAGAPRGSGTHSALIRLAPGRRMAITVPRLIRMHILRA
jgi:hypothetical protein